MPATVNTCSGTFYDSGGAGGNYSANEAYTKTFCSDNGENLQFDFTAFDVQSTWDRLRIYDGPNTSSTLIGTYTTTVPTTIISSGTCLTFKFSSDCCVDKLGWSATISCFDPGTCGTNPAANDACLSATVLNNLDGICGTSGGYTLDAMSGDLQANFCTGVNWISNNSWLTFQASSNIVELYIMPSNCTGNGIEVGIFETTDCINFTEIECWDPFYNDAPGYLEITGLTIGNDYYIMIDPQTGVCDYLINGLTGITILPITLSKLNSSCHTNNTTLSWTTQSEINNDYYTIERSNNGIDFESIGRVNGAGTSTNQTDYQFTDYVSSNTLVYYRLGQTDFDGTYTYSQTISSDCKNENTLNTSIFPNPANRKLNLNYNNRLNEFGDMTITIVTITGETVHKTDYDIESLSIETIDVSNLSKGIYIVNFGSKQIQESHKLVIE